jgi:hypothetical protein
MDQEPDRTTTRNHTAPIAGWPARRLLLRQLGTRVQQSADSARHGRETPARRGKCSTRDLAVIWRQCRSEPLLGLLAQGYRSGRPIDRRWLRMLTFRRGGPTFI